MVNKHGRYLLFIFRLAAGIFLFLRRFFHSLSFFLSLSFSLSLCLSVSLLFQIFQNLSVSFSSPFVFNYYLLFYFVCCFFFLKKCLYSHAIDRFRSLCAESVAMHFANVKRDIRPFIDSSNLKKKRTMRDKLQRLSLFN